MNGDREKLVSLESEGKFVFHGSPQLLEELVPKQPTISNKETGKKENHGNPCVAATPFAEIAIFRAIINSKNFPMNNYGSSFTINDQGKIEFVITQEVFKALKGKTGYVYVFDKKDFKEFSEIECRSSSRVEPLQIISVFTEDLPEGIEVKDDL